MGKLYRSETDRLLGGVCGGLGEYLSMDPLLLRIAFVVMTIANGVSVVVYILLWLLVPRGSTLDGRWAGADSKGGQQLGTHHEQSGQRDPVALGPGYGAPSDGGVVVSNRMVVGGALLVAVGLLILLDNYGLLFWLNARGLGPLLLMALGSVLVLNALKDKR